MRALELSVPRVRKLPSSVKVAVAALVSPDRSKRPDASLLLNGGLLQCGNQLTQLLPNHRNFHVIHEFISAWHTSSSWTERAQRTSLYSQTLASSLSPFDGTLELVLPYILGLLAPDCCHLPEVVANAVSCWEVISEAVGRRFTIVRLLPPLLQLYNYLHRVIDIAANDDDAGDDGDEKGKMEPIREEGGRRRRRRRRRAKRVRGE